MSHFNNDNMNEMWRVHMPYCLHGLEDGYWILLNRTYKPLGLAFADWVDYETHPSRFRFKKKLSEKQIAEIAYYRAPGDYSRVWLYGDGSTPSSGSGDMQAYTKRLARLMSWKIEHDKDAPAIPQAKPVSHSEQSKSYQIVLSAFDMGQVMRLGQVLDVIGDRISRRSVCRYLKEAVDLGDLEQLHHGVYCRVGGSPTVESGERRNNNMVKLFKDGKALSLQTDASDEAQFTRDFSLALQDFMTGPQFEGQHQIETWIKHHADICCKLRGYKAESVREQRLLTIGEINPSSETLVNITEYGAQTLKAVV